MILFHGTNVEFNKIEINKTKKFKDFGQGFYLTDIRSQAEELACKRALMFRITMTLSLVQLLMMEWHTS